MYAYSLYLFFDFAGYTAFAVGVSNLFGIHSPENFRRPFLARDIRDFWNRWHISLSWWFRDHVYMRFVLAATRGRWFGDRYLASYAGFFLSMGLMGLWHGFEAQYIGYGLYHGALLTAHDVFSRWNKLHQVWGEGPVWRAAGIVLTIQAVCFGFLIFSGHLSIR
jgi:membrane protein involved in D-alanine export